MAVVGLRVQSASFRLLGGIRIYTCAGQIELLRRLVVMFASGTGHVLASFHFSHCFRFYFMSMLDQLEGYGYVLHVGLS